MLVEKECPLLKGFLREKIIQAIWDQNEALIWLVLMIYLLC